LELFAANSTHLWATYCDNCVRTVPDGCKAWTVTGISNNTVTVSEVSGTTMPAYTPLLISRSEAGTDAVVAEYSADGNQNAVFPVFLRPERIKQHGILRMNSFTVMSVSPSVFICYH
jgi:hypothetical protein